MRARFASASSIGLTLTAPVIPGLDIETIEQRENMAPLDEDREDDEVSKEVTPEKQPEQREKKMVIVVTGPQEEREANKEDAVNTVDSEKDEIEVQNKLEEETERNVDMVKDNEEVVEAAANTAT
eukprot:CAMPEP_0197037456 /NCGR_PEP_ID=MMETSP1384-20130603/14669_1 /TAXON_ID=29189 /ORGANISM="Ammonia sp." /LENGTH=124 /DNA_ID=CAMNT_0042467767 /DNA_START=15 /DNA_END=386 /DNA_ORIENTATION=+